MPRKHWNDCEHPPHSIEQIELVRECGTGVQGEVETREGKRSKESSRIPFESHQLKRDRYREIQLVDEKKPLAA